MANAALSILTQLKAENLLAGSDLLDRITKLSNALTTTTEGSQISLTDYFLLLQADKTKIKHLELEENVNAITSGDYIRRLASSLEEILDEIEVHRDRVINFQGRLKDAQTDTQDLAAEFDVWYTLAANEQLRGTEIKLPAASVKALATSEYNRLMNRANVTVESLGEGLKALLVQLNSKKQLAKDKFAMGKDQAYSVFSGGGRPENQGYNTGDDNPTAYSHESSEPVDDEPLPTFMQTPITVQTEVGPVPQEYVGYVTGGPTDTGTVEVHIPASTVVVKVKPEPVADPLDISIEAEKPVAPAPYDDNCYLDTNCSKWKCGQRQFNTPSGVTCKGGHGGAPAAEDQAAEWTASTPLKVGDPVTFKTVTEEQAVTLMVVDDGEEAPVSPVVDDDDTPAPAATFTGIDDDDDLPGAAPTPTPAPVENSKSLPISAAAQATVQSLGPDELDDIVTTSAPAPTPVETPATITTEHAKTRKRLTFDFNLDTESLEK